MRRVRVEVYSMKSSPRAWDRRLWGVVLHADHVTLIGSAWNGDVPAHPGEPTRPLLFTTRAQARQWCAENADQTACCAAWRFRPVRVRETIRTVSKES